MGMDKYYYQKQQSSLGKHPRLHAHEPWPIDPGWNFGNSSKNTHKKEKGSTNILPNVWS